MRGGTIITTPDEGLWLVIDQGGHASRVLVFDGHGTQVAGAQRPVDVRHPRPGWVEQDAAQVLDSVRGALAAVAAQLGSACCRLRAAGLATQRSTVVCWDRVSGAPLSPAISWQDRRGAVWMRRFTAQRAQIRAITGLLPSAHYGVSKLHWCLEHLPAVRAAHHRGDLACAPLAAFLLSRLLQETPWVVDSVNASRTLLWDWRRRCWSSELLAMFGLQADYLPTGVPNRYDSGHLQVGNSEVPMRVCHGDQPAALFAAGTPQPGTGYINVGTGAFVQCIMPPEVAAQDTAEQGKLLRSVVWDQEDGAIQALEATVNGAGSALAVVANELGIPLSRAESQYEQWLTVSGPVPVYLNGIGGLGSPFWRADFQSGFVGTQVESADAGAKMVAVLESIIFLLCLNLEEMEQAGIRLRCLVLSGGLSRVDGLCQRLADVSGLSVQRPAQQEATGKGLAYLLVGPGSAWRTHHQDRLFPVRPNPALAARYTQWRKAMDAALAAPPETGKPR